MCVGWRCVVCKDRSDCTGQKCKGWCTHDDCVSLAIVEPGTDADYARSCADNSVFDNILLDKPDHPIDKHE